MQAKSAHPDVFSDYSSLYKNMKKSCGQKEKGPLWRTEEAFVDIVSSVTLRYLRHREARYLSVSFSCAFAVSNSNNKSPIETASSFFFPLDKHTKLPVLGCNCPVLRQPLLVALLCTCFMFYSTSKSIKYFIRHFVSWFFGVWLCFLCVRKAKLPYKATLFHRDNKMKHKPSRISWGSNHLTVCTLRSISRWYCICWIFTWPLTESISYLLEESVYSISHFQVQKKTIGTELQGACARACLSIN